MLGRRFPREKGRDKLIFSICGCSLSAAPFAHCAHVERSCHGSSIRVKTKGWIKGRGDIKEVRGCITVLSP